MGQCEEQLSQSDFETAELGYKVRKTNYQNLLENTILRTPITGFVTARNFDQGDMFSMSAPLFTVQQVVPVKLLVGISESEYTKVKKGQSVAIKADALPGRSFTGKVERLYPTIDAATHTFRAEVHVANTDRVLRPGMYARVTVNYGSNHSIVVPDLCIVKQEASGRPSRLPWRPFSPRRKHRRPIRGACLLPLHSNGGSPGGGPHRA